MKLASTRVVAEAVSYGHEDLDRAVELWQFVSEQKLLDGLPSPGSVIDDVEFRARQDIERRDRQAQLTLLDALYRLRTHMAGVEDSIKRVRRARVALGSQVPAVDAALNVRYADAIDAARKTYASVAGKSTKAGVGPDGRPGTSGVSLEEADRVRKGAVEAEAACLCCEFGVSEVGRLKSGFCKSDYDAWWRAGQPDRGPWIIERRRYLEQKADNEAEIIQLRADSPYRALKEVA